MGVWGLLLSQIYLINQVSHILHELLDVVKLLLDERIESYVCTLHTQIASQCQSRRPDLAHSFFFLCMSLRWMVWYDVVNVFVDSTGSVPRLKWFDFFLYLVKGYSKRLELIGLINKLFKI